MIPRAQTERIRNFGIAAHVDAGKTTLAERVLFYAQRIHAIHEVKGGATMDPMALEQEKGISIQAAATTAAWREHQLNLIDTPGHVDFTVEVERALRVLDGAVLLLCAVGGVQAQTRTVDRQMRRHRIPRVAFVNKLDRAGADPERVVQELAESLGLRPLVLQLPVGLGAELEGLIDLVEMRLLRFEGEHGERVVVEAIPAGLRSAALEGRERLLDALSALDDGVLEALLEGRPITLGLLRAALRRVVLARSGVPVLMGSAYRNVGVQPLLDAVVDLLPSPFDSVVEALDAEGEATRLEVDAEGEPAALVFKVQALQHGDLAWLRIYRGAITKGSSLFNPRSGKRLRVGRLGRLHAGRLEATEGGAAGEILALATTGLVTGDALTGGEVLHFGELVVPEPVVEVALTRGVGQRGLDRALARMAREDPTFHVRTDAETGEIRLLGMGELHLEVCVERLRREHGVEVAVGAPTVSHREALEGPASFDHLHRKQNGGKGEYAKVSGRLEVIDDGFEFDWQIRSGAIPSHFRRAVREGFEDAFANGFAEGVPVIGVRVVVSDGKAHSDDSSERAFYIAAREAARQAVESVGLRRLEPRMSVSVEAGPDDHGAILRTLLQRRGSILGAEAEAGLARVEAEVPLAEMFGYAGALRSATGGAGTFTMRFAGYAPVQ